MAPAAGREWPLCVGAPTAQTTRLDIGHLNPGIYLVQYGAEKPACAVDCSLIQRKLNEPVSVSTGSPFGGHSISPSRVMVLKKFN